MTDKCQNGKKNLVYQRDKAQSGSNVSCLSLHTVPRGLCRKRERVRHRADNQKK